MYQLETFCFSPLSLQTTLHKIPTHADTDAVRFSRALVQASERLFLPFLAIALLDYRLFVTLFIVNSYII
jgi:hypothetical protein